MAGSLRARKPTDPIAAQTVAQPLRMAGRLQKSGTLTQLQALADARPAIEQRLVTDASPTVQRLQALADTRPQIQRLQALRRQAENDKPRQGQPVQRMENGAGHNGLPPRLKAGIESLSGLSMDGVRVHRNSAEPAKVSAHAFARGRDIHLGPGQERHLPHEAWHVVQQNQGRVRPTMQLKGVAINNDAGLEAEADRMGAHALTLRPGRNASAKTMVTALPRHAGSNTTGDLLQRTEVEALQLADRLHPGKKKFESIEQVLEAKLEFGREDYAEIVRAYNRDLGPGKARLRKVYPEPESEPEELPGLKGRIIGYDHMGRPFTQTTMEKIEERLRLAIHRAIHHAPDLASTAVEAATHTVDAKALKTATTEFMTAIRETGGDLRAGDYNSFAMHLVDATAGAIRSGASMARVTHTVSGALAHAGTGIPGIGLLVRLSGDAMWYSAEYVRDGVRANMIPRIHRNVNYKKRIGKHD